MESLKEIRVEKKLTQQQVAEQVGISLRSYKTYENDASKINSIKYRYIMELLATMNPVDETHGILSVDDIKNKCSEIFSDKDVEFCYLFGSYARSKATQTSDVDLLISTSVSGLKFFALIEEIRTKLRKKVDVLDLNQLKDNSELVHEVLKDGIKIYG